MTQSQKTDRDTINAKSSGEGQSSGWGNPDIRNSGTGSLGGCELDDKGSHGSSPKLEAEEGT